MSIVRGTWKNGQIFPDGPVTWREGSRLVIREQSPAEIEFLTEEEQRDDPEAIQQWIDDLRAIPPVPLTPEQEADLLVWRRKSKEFNLEAVRRQMEEGVP